jgi:hypothetical protein
MIYDNDKMISSAESLFGYLATRTDNIPNNGLTSNKTIGGDYYNEIFKQYRGKERFIIF